jgi:predicted amidohydrolase
VTAASTRRARLLRLRAIEHRIATAAFAQADAEFANVSTVAERLAGLRAGITMPDGETSARDFHCLAELSARLDVARDRLDRSLADADRSRADRARARGIAHLAEERAKKLHAKAAQREAAEREMRADAAFIVRVRHQGERL